MILHLLKLKNFKQYVDETIEFRGGLVGIAGRNGAGKSSVFEAILLALYGYFEITNDHIRTSWAEEGTEVLVELQFQLGQDNYRVVREFKGKRLTPKAFLYDAHDNLITPTGKTSPVNEEITRLLGMDMKTFRKSIFSGQKELSEISKLSREERLKMIRNMLGLERLDTIQKWVRQDRNDRRSKIEVQESSLLDVNELKAKQEELSSANKTSKQFKTDVEKFKKAFEEQNKLYQENKQQYDIQNKLFNDDKDLANKLKSAADLIELLQNNVKENQLKQQALKEIKEQIDKQEPQIAEFEQKKAQREQLEKAKEQFDLKGKWQERLDALRQDEQKYQQEIQLITKELAPVEDLKLDFEKIKTTIEQFKKKEKQLNVNIAELRQSIGAIQGKIKDRESQIKTISALGKDADCPTCLQPLVKSYDATLNKLNQEIADYQKQELEALQAKISKSEKELEGVQKEQKEKQTKQNKLSNELTRLQEKTRRLKEVEQESNRLKNEQNTLKDKIKNLGKIDFQPATYEKIKQEIAAFKPTYQAYKDNLVRLNQLPDLMKERSNIEERIEKGHKFVIDTNKIRTNLKFSVSEYESTRKKRDKAEKERDAIRNKLEEQQNQLKTIEVNIARIDEQIKSHEKVRLNIETLRNEFEELEVLSGLFEKFKKYILTQVRPTIARSAGQLFNQITKGRYEDIDINDNFEFFILDNGKYYPIDRFSGGEVDLANLCLRIGISKAITQLSGSESAQGFLGFDEIFGSQDEERRQDIMLALDLLKEQYRQIYIVSHIDTIKDHFPNILEVRKSEEGSQAYWLD